MSQPEQAFQRAVAAFLDVALPSNCYWTAIGHGGGGEIRGAILKGMGLKAGCPDVLIVHDGKARFIELKAPRGALSQSQKLAHLALTNAGASVATCKTLEQIEAELKSHGIELRASLRG